MIRGWTPQLTLLVVGAARKWPAIYPADRTILPHGRSNYFAAVRVCRPSYIEQLVETLRQEVTGGSAERVGEVAEAGEGQRPA